MKENIVLHSIGDRVPTGTFTEIESVFEKVVNFVWDNKVIAIGTPELYPGPYHIVISGVGTDQIKGVEIRKCEVRSEKSEEKEENNPPPPLIKGGCDSAVLNTENSKNGILMYTEDSKIGILLHRETDSRIGILLYPEVSYDSALDVKHMNKLLLIDNLKYLRISLLNRFEDDSLVFLLERRSGRNQELGVKLIRHSVPPSLYPKGRITEPPEEGGTLQKGTGNREQGTAQRTKEIPPKEGGTESETGIEIEDSKIGILLHFEEAYRFKFKELFTQLKENKTPESVLSFHGYGYGLTPAGDDFIIGYMIGLQILSIIGKNELSKQLDILYSGMFRLSSNRLVNTFVQMAYEGSYSEPWKMFIEAMLSKDLNDYEELLNSILNIGSTSGSDTLVGMITALELLI